VLQRVSKTSGKLLAQLCTDSDEPGLDSILLVAAHPDDEAIGAGSRFPRFASVFHFVHVTDGSPRDLSDAERNGFTTRQQYADARRAELHQVLRASGIPADRARTLGIVDQEASLNLAEISRQLAAIIHELSPDLILTHPYEGGHPDHDAVAFGVHAALRLTKTADRSALVEFTSYHRKQDGGITPDFLPNSSNPQVTVVLSPAQRRKKREMLRTFATQQHTIGGFEVAIERYRLAPDYDFAHPPHEGLLLYEEHAWGMTGERFRELARAALKELGLEDRACA
jgi:LmbE family N-acetylglucosaminyl deacetylase